MAHDCRVKVLVVDDDEAIRSAVTQILEFEGYSVVAAADGAEALAAVEAALPCLVLLDMRMPILDGWGFAAALRQRGLRIPIAVMTAAHNAQRWCDEIGGDACLSKPFDLDDMVATVARFCLAPAAGALAPPRAGAR